MPSHREPLDVYGCHEGPDEPLSQKEATNTSLARFLNGPNGLLFYFIVVLLFASPLSVCGLCNRALSFPNGGEST